ncbi:MAG: glycoside hydrolase family 73 protein, partial [Streptococcaceae bacterium]|nr:glycoside hydrolase family 73 protein [Streptococcaceae bacterium]
EVEQQRAEEVKREDFIKKIAPHAQLLGHSYGIFPSIILAQASLESDFGQSVLGKKYNNLFGVKGYGTQEKVKLETKEFVNGKWTTVHADFRVYPNWNASIDQHMQLFINGVDWNPQLYAKVFEATTFQQAAEEVQNAGYATDPGYAKKLIQMIKEYHLYRYDDR